MGLRMHAHCFLRMPCREVVHFANMLAFTGKMRRLYAFIKEVAFMQIEKNIAATLQYKMEAERKTKLELSKELGIPRSTLQGYLKGERSLRSDSIEEVAGKLGISPAQLISGPEWSTAKAKLPNMDAFLGLLQALHPKTHGLAREVMTLLHTASRISGELYDVECPWEVPVPPEAVYQYHLHESWDPIRMTYLYGLLVKERAADGWVTVAVVAPFSNDRMAAAKLAKRCAELQLSPVHILDVIRDFRVQGILG